MVVYYLITTFYVLQLTPDADPVKFKTDLEILASQIVVHTREDFAAQTRRRVLSDVLPILREASGVVAVGRLNHSTRDGLRRFQEVVNMAGGSLLGIVATDTRAGGLYDGYGYGYGYGYGGYGVQPDAQNGQAASVRRQPAGG